MAMQMQGSRKGAIAEINVTPFVDVLLVLLIIFMVVTPLSQRALDTALPQDAKAPTPGPTPVTPQPLVLEVTDSGWMLNQTVMANLADLEARLRDIFETRADKTLFVRGSGNVTYGQVVAAMDVARGAGARRLGLMSAGAR